MKKHNLLKTILICIAVYFVLSWIIKPSTLTGSAIIANEEFARIGIWNIFNMFGISISNFISYGIFLCAVGLFYIILNKTNVYQNLINKISKKAKKHSYVFIGIVVSMFAILSSITNLGIILFLFVPFFISILIKMGYDKITALLSTFGGIFVGIIGSTLGYNVTYIINQTLSLDLMDSIYQKVCLLIVCTVILITYIISYVKKLKTNKVEIAKIEDPMLIDATSKKGSKKTWPIIAILIFVAVVTLIGCIKWETIFTFFTKNTPFTKFNEAVMGVKIGSFEIFKSILGVGVYYPELGIQALGNWSYMDITIVLVLASLLIALIYKVKFNEVIDGLRDSIKKFQTPTLLIILACTLLVTSTYHNVFLTVMGWFGDTFNIVTTSLIAMLSSVTHVEMQYVAQSAISPLVSVLGDTSLNSLIAVLFQSIYGLVSFVAPTSLMLILGLTYLDVSYKDWFKSIWKLLVELLVVIFIVLIVIATF